MMSKEQLQQRYAEVARQWKAAMAAEMKALTAYKDADRRGNSLFRAYEKAQDVRVALSKEAQDLLSALAAPEPEPVDEQAILLSVSSGASLTPFRGLEEGIPPPCACMHVTPGETARAGGLRRREVVRSDGS